jgi:hypothetical protein
MSHSAKNYANKVGLRGSHLRHGPLADIIQELGNPGFSTISARFKHADFENGGGTTDTVTLAKLPKGAEVVKVILDIKAAFTASGGTSTTVSLGTDASSPTDLCEARQVQSGAPTLGRTTWTLDSDEGADEADVSASATALVLTLVRSGSTPSLLTAGEIGVCVLYSVMPT